MRPKQTAPRASPADELTPAHRSDSVTAVLAPQVSLGKGIHELLSLLKSRGFDSAAATEEEKGGDGAGEDGDRAEQLAGGCSRVKPDFTRSLSLNVRRVPFSGHEKWFSLQKEKKKREKKKKQSKC